MIALLLAVAIEIKIQHPDLIFRGALFSFLLLVFLLLQQETVWQLIPHHLGIY